MNKDVLGIGQEGGGLVQEEFSGQLIEPISFTYQTNQAWLTWYSDFNIIRQGWSVTYETGRCFYENGVKKQVTSDLF